MIDDGALLTGETAAKSVRVDSKGGRENDGACAETASQGAGLVHFDATVAWERLGTVGAGERNERRWAFTAEFLFFYCVSFVNDPGE